MTCDVYTGDEPGYSGKDREYPGSKQVQEMKKTSAPPVSDYRSLDAWLERFGRVAGNFKWFLLDGRKLRTKIEGQQVCPLLAYAYVRSSNVKEERSVPDTRNLSGSVGVHDSVAAAVVHIADAMVTSRYYSADKRKQLLQACKVREPEEEEAEFIPDVTS